MTTTLEIENLTSKIACLNDDEIHIYSLYMGDVCIYVGQSIVLQKRIYQHLLDGKEFDLVKAEVVPLIDANINEADTIVYLQPTLNKSLPKTEKYLSTHDLKSAALRAISSIDGNSGTKYSCETNKNSSRHYILSSQGKEILSDLEDSINKHLVSPKHCMVKPTKGDEA